MVESRESFRANPAPRALADAWVACGLALLAALVHWPLLLAVAGGCDEWHVLQIGVNLRHGDLLYTDTNHIAGPGSFYGMAALFSIFGESLLVARLTMLLLFSALVGVTYLLCRRLTGTTASILAALVLIGLRLWTFPHFAIFHYATTALVLVTIGFWTLRAHDNPSNSRIATAGLLCGLAFLTKQDSGALGGAGAFIALLAGYALQRYRQPPGSSLLRKALVFLSAAATPFLLACLYFLVKGGLGPYLWQTIYDPIFLNALFGAGAGPDAADYLDIPRLFPLGEQDPEVRRFLFSWMPGLLWDLHWRDILDSWIYRETSWLDLSLKLIYRLPTLVLLLEAVLLAGRWLGRGKRQTTIHVLAARTAQLAFTAGLWMAFSKPRDWIHFSILLTAFLPILARQIDAFVRRLPSLWRPVFYLPAGAAVLLFLAGSAHLEIRALETFNTPVQGVRGTVWVRPEDAIAYQKLIDHLRETPEDQPVLVVPCLPVLSFLADRPPLSRFIWLWPRDAYEDREQQIMADLERHPDTSIVYTLMHTPFAPRPQVTVPELFDYLAKNYAMTAVHGAPDRLSCGIAERRPPEPASYNSLGLSTIPLHEKLPGAMARRADNIEVVTDAIAGVENWPLTRDVLYLQPGTHGPNRLAIPVTIPPHARLRTTAGVHPDLWQSLGPFPLRLEIAIQSPRGSEILFRQEFDVFGKPETRLWKDIDADLSSWAGEDVMIVFRAEALGWEPGAKEIAGFSEPRILQTNQRLDAAILR
jgi:hypothetical protein